MNLRIVFLGSLVLFACNKHEKVAEIQKPEISKKAAPEPPKDLSSSTSSFESTYQRFIQDLKSSNIDDLKSIMDTDVSCCETGILDCTNRYFKNENKGEKEEIRKR